MSWVHLALLGAILLVGAQGASLATAKDEKSNCTVSNGMQAITCLFRMNDFMEKIDELDMDDKEEVKEFKRSCDSLQSCFMALDCRGNHDVETVKVSTMIKNYCDSVVYIATDFAPCGDKLEENKSECFDDWDPFPSEKDSEKTEKSKEEACKNFFGKDNCLKTEITKTCSEKQWIGFRDHFLTLNSIVKQCTF